MADDARRRREQRLKFAQIRIAERGDYSDPDRGDYSDPDRGDYSDPDRGDYSDPDRGGFGLGAAVSQSQAAADILRRAVGLGGHLVVAFVSPVGASPVSRRRSRRSRPSDLTTAGARARVTERIKAKTPVGGKPAIPGQTGAGFSSNPAGQVPPKSTGY
jgi:hypothetical protein